jgi:hypothetical protein
MKDINGVLKSFKAEKLESSNLISITDNHCLLFLLFYVTNFLSTYCIHFKNRWIVDFFLQYPNLCHNYFKNNIHFFRIVIVGFFIQTEKEWIKNNLKGILLFFYDDQGHKYLLQIVKIMCVGHLLLNWQENKWQVSRKRPFLWL